MLVADLATVRPHVCLDDETFARAGRLAAEERVNLFLPARPDGPAWLAPSTSAGLLGVMVALPRPLPGPRRAAGPPLREQRQPDG